MKRFLEKGAPILIIIILCILVLVWALGGFLAGTFAGGSILIGGVFFLIGLAVIAALIVTLVRRIKEIDDEDKDDLSKY
ncbi:hypothetical protein C3B58_03520 [Lactonifactor longoviformis]|uniref:Uncharacterized protein n=1 Tax=Lactonifactor longoviformis DSM 17459 TaxID=1122155 RepID=A0A1M4U3U0_9CLOT|nr:hypothetical protein [Lactonifactor longoviformis]POP34291.1 hypothetical protein C3B58_03520 [Lactonifactor longoviformis]SHE51392.1 hypothetical protein SAMN02745158_00718 [Lactonifactor longoviformis DSM 17459]